MGRESERTIQNDCKRVDSAVELWMRGQSTLSLEFNFQTIFFLRHSSSFSSHLFIYIYSTYSNNGITQKYHGINSVHGNRNVLMYNNTFMTVQYKVAAWLLNRIEHFICHHYHHHHTAKFHKRKRHIEWWAIWRYYCEKKKIAYEPMKNCRKKICMADKGTKVLVWNT